MCGIAGFWAPESPGYTPEPVLAAMSDALRHRGPDSSGCWWRPEANVGFGHRRLSIIDLSEEGAQPMHSASGRYTMSYNGEVFNYEDLRGRLEPASWRGHSDTEVMLEAFEQWGVEGALSKFNGQFAFSVWDDRSRSLTLVRDRVGIKPLYYGCLGGTFVFASELEAIRAHPSFRERLNPEAVVGLIELGYIPAPLSIYHGVFKLPPGTILTLRYPGDEPLPRYFWDLRDVATKAEFRLSDAGSACDELDSLVRDAVSLRMIADVPLGAFLSGGVDSSLVCGVMQSLATGPVKTFSIGFEEVEFDEAPFARKVAEHLETDHTELYVTPDEAMNVIPELPALYDEPFADASQIPTYLVSRLAREHVTVSLSGDGGDELFGGYERYRRVLGRWPRISGVPRPVRMAVARAASLASGIEQNSIVQNLMSRVPKSMHRLVGFGQYGRAVGLIGSQDIGEFYRRSFSLTATGFAGPILQGSINHGPVLNPEIPTGLGPLDTMTYVDMLSYLPDDILVKLDRASMAVSLEGRVPLLDYRIVEFSWRLSPDLKVRDGDQKWLLKHLLERYVPRSITERPKRGFAVPIGNWLRGPLSDWAESLLDERSLADDGVFDPASVRRLWRLHLDGRAEVHDLLWRVLTYQAWVRRSQAPAPRVNQHVSAV